MKRAVLAVVLLLLMPLVAIPVLAVAYAQNQDAGFCPPVETPGRADQSVAAVGRSSAAPFDATPSAEGQDGRAGAVLDTDCGLGPEVAPADAFVGGATGCSVPDPSTTGGCVTPALAWLMHQVEQRFGRLPVACWSWRGGDPYSDHPKGKACDYTFGRIGSYPGPHDVRHGWALATWLRANAVALQVNYVIWQGRIWSRTHDAEGWRPYTGGGQYSTSGPTNGHYDHVHVSTL